VQYSAHSAKTDASHQEELQCQQDQVHPVLDHEPLALSLSLAQLSPGIVELSFQVIPLAFNPVKFLAQVPIFCRTGTGFVLPLVSALSES